MAGRGFIDFVRPYFLVIPSCVIYTAFFTWGLIEIFSLDGAHYRVIYGVIFVVLMVIGVGYYVPMLRYTARGGKIDHKKRSNILAFYLGTIVSAAFFTAVVMVWLEDFVVLEGWGFRIVSGVVFMTFAVSHLVYFRRIRQGG
ncbi:hypothetical protein NVV94_25635 [Pseudomonas sp. LS1212]|uniref:hypothetical protein n=1 Tax=Pseudomonas sp. LS1212 TaxID=2972478 RepID=UPI00215D3BF0|nr:hypothetical protein [Pseudomonas sp. LS1212]UVJ43861.1 hypothetical protein NVV94_25635 [Pseudomonas sp. LS1212]